MKPWLRATISFVKAHKKGIVLIGIILIAAFFRLWRLWDLPPGLHPDEAANGLDIFRMGQGDIRPLYNTNGPRESLFFFWQGFWVWLLGNTAFALRLGAALVGVGTVYVTYLWSKQWFSKRTALLAAFFTAIGSWAITLNRDGFRANLVPLFIALSIWLVTVSIKKGKWYWYALAGASFGAGFYTYISYKFMLPLILMLFGFMAVRHRNRIKRMLKPAIIFATAAFIVFLPLGIYGISHPDEVFLGRSSVSITNPDLNEGNLPKTALDNIVKTALMFNFAGDPNYRHNLGGAPMMGAFAGIMFLLGLLISVRRWKDIRYFTLVSIFGVMLLPMVATAEGIPHGLRAIGVIPVIYIFAAIAVVELLRRWQVVFPRNRAAQLVGIYTVIALAILSTFYSYQRYFVAWANAPETFEAYSEDATEIARFLNTTGFNGQRVVVIDNYSHKTVEFLTRGKGSHTHVEARDLPSLNLTGPVQIVIVDTQLAEAKEYLQNLDLKFKVSPVRSEARPKHSLFTIYEVSDG